MTIVPVPHTGGCRRPRTQRLSAVPSPATDARSKDRHGAKMTGADVLKAGGWIADGTTMETLAAATATVSSSRLDERTHFDAATGYLATTLVAAPMALFGLVGNALVAVLFTKSGMRNTPTSIFFTTLAICDCVTIALCITFLSLKAYEERQYANGLVCSDPGIAIAEIFALDCLQFTIIWSTWIIVAILFFRYHVVSKPNKAAYAWRAPRTKRVVLVVTGLSLALSLPVTLRFKPRSLPVEVTDKNSTSKVDTRGYRVAIGDFSDYFVYKVVYSYVIYYAFAYLLPLCLQAYLSIRLAKSLRSITYPLRRSSLASMVVANPDGLAGRFERSRRKVTLVTIAIATLNLICSIPWAVLAVVREEIGLQSYSFHIVGNTARVFLVFNCSMDCVLFSFVSKSFRRQLSQRLRNTPSLTPSTALVGARSCYRKPTFLFSEKENECGSSSTTAIA